MKTRAEITENVKTFFTDLRTYWNKPRPGEYVSNKEFLFFVLGSGGSNNAQYRAAICLLLHRACLSVRSTV